MVQTAKLSELTGTYKRCYKRHFILRENQGFGELYKTNRKAKREDNRLGEDCNTHTLYASSYGLINK